MRAVHVVIASLAFLLGLLSPRLAAAADYTWTGPHNGRWSDDFNWSPAGGPPGPTDAATFSLPGTDPYNVAFPGASREERVGSIEVVGDSLTIEAFRLMTLTSTSPTALHLRTVDGRPARLSITRSVDIPNGGITLSGATTDFARGNWLQVAPQSSANNLTILSGGTAGLTIAGDVQVGNPGAPRGSATVASYGRHRRRRRPRPPRRHTWRNRGRRRHPQCRQDQRRDLPRGPDQRRRIRDRLVHVL